MNAVLKTDGVSPSAGNVAIWTSEGGRVSKHIERGTDGKIRKMAPRVTTPDHVCVKGVESLMELARIHVGLRATQYLTYGVPERPATRVVTKRQFEQQGRPSDAITRSQEDLKYPAGPGFLVIDYDPSPEAQAMGQEALIEALGKVIPGFQQTGFMWEASSGGCIYDQKTGEELIGVRGQHITIMVENAADIPRATAVLFKRFWLAGHGSIKVGAAGTALVRAPVDCAVAQPQQPIYVADAVCGVGLVQKRPEPEVVSGPALNTLAALPDLTEEEEHRYQELVAEAKSAAAPECGAKRRAWIDACIAQGVDADDARRTAHSLAAGGGVLYGTHPLIILKGGAEVPVTVAEVLEDPERYDGALTLDPVEPDYRGGGQRGKIYTKGQRHPVLHSMAHGGMRYKLARSESDLVARPEDFEDLTGAAEAEAQLPDDEGQGLSHDELALDLSKRGGWAETARYVDSWGKWLFWDGCRWEQDDKLRHMTEIRRFLRRVASERRKAVGQPGMTPEQQKRAKRDAHMLRQADTCASVQTTAKSNPDLAASPDDFDKDPDILGTPGGIVDLRTGRMRAATPGDNITKTTAVAPAPPGTPAPLWEAFLRKTQREDPQMLDFLQQLCGYALTGHTTEHKFAFLWGPGGNGKSVFVNTFYRLMGDYARRAPAETFLDSPGQRHPTELAGLRGARLVIGSELPPGRRWNESVIKDLTGGDYISARLMRQDFFDYKPQFSLWIYGNHQPSFRGVDDAIRRRVLLTPFTEKIPEHRKDTRLEKKLEAEWPAILRWAIEGARKWYEAGLNLPARVAEASEEYLDSEDAIKQFMTERLTENPEGRVPMKEVYEVFQRWSGDNGRVLWSQTALTRNLRDRGFEIGRQSSGRVLHGFVLRDRSAHDSVECSEFENLC